MASAPACGPSGGSPATYTVRFALSDSPELLATLSFKVEYEAGNFDGNGSAVACTLLNTADGETADFVDDDSGTLTIAIDATDNPLDAPENIVTCEFTSTIQPIAGTFTLTPLAAVDDFDDPVAVGDIALQVTSTDLSTSSSLVAQANP
jgi:hypothetical protein